MLRAFAPLVALVLVAAPAAAQAPGAADVAAITGAALKLGLVPPVSAEPESVLSPAPALALAPAPSALRVTDDAYVAIGFGAGGKAYAASGVGLRSVNAAGHGGFVRLEQGETSWLSLASANDRYVLALDMGYSFGGVLVGKWGDGLLGFVELGLSGWHAGGSSLSAYEESLGGEARDGLGVAASASVEARIGDLRVGMAVARREVPFVVGAMDAFSSTALQLRLGGIL